MELYIDVELTGSMWAAFVSLDEGESEAYLCCVAGHTQFFDKFNIRHHLSGVLKALWAEFPRSHRQAFIEQSKYGAVVG